eukprot:4865223-Pleurochrysis_carterae.AAC.2
MSFIQSSACRRHTARPRARASVYALCELRASRDACARLLAVTCADVRSYLDPNVSDVTAYCSPCAPYTM